MKTFNLKITTDLDGRKIEYVLKKHLGFSSSLITKLKRREGAVMKNGQAAKMPESLHCGDELYVTVEEKKPKILPSEISLEILYEDEDILAVNKPRAMPTHPSRNHHNDTLANAVIHYLGSSASFHVITRLDKNTSGVTLLAKNTVAAKLLTDKIKQNDIKKEYFAIVNGVPVPHKGEVCAPIAKKEGSGIARCISPEGKTALTHYEVIYSNESYSLIHLFPHTGRTHQLRLHMAYIGTPICGDCIYGTAKNNEATLLHCGKISFLHPFTKKALTICAPLPTDMDSRNQQ